MTKTVNIHEAKTHFSKLLEQVADGHEVIIARAGKPVARLSALQNAPKKRVLGSLKGKISMAEDFDASLPDSFWLGEE